MLLLIQRRLFLTCDSCESNPAAAAAFCAAEERRLAAADEEVMANASVGGIVSDIRQTLVDSPKCRQRLS